MTKSSSNRRCFHYNIDGDPLKGGCPRRSSSCGFYHPEEEGWATARIPTYRAPKKRRRSNTPPSYVGTRRDSGYPRNRHSRSRSRSRTPVRRPRRDSIASSSPESPRNPRIGRPGVDLSDSRKMSLNDNNLNKGQQQAQSTTSSTLRSSSPRIQGSSSSSLPNPPVSLPTPPVTALQSGGFGDTPLPDRRPRITTSYTTNSGALLPSSPSSSHQRWPSLTRSDQSAPLAPPAPPKETPPMRPLPIVPSSLYAGVAPVTTTEPTVEEKRAIWEERTRILSESELAREQLAGLEDQYAFALQVIESRYYNNLPEEDKTRLKDQLAELEKQRDEAKRTHEESLEKLFKTGSWPTGPPSTIEDGMEEKQKEVLKYIQELKDTASRTSEILGDISTLKMPPLFLADSDDEDGAIMDVDQPDGDTAHPQSLKRRHISGSGYTSSMPTQEELDEFLERLAHMEGLISTLENDINEHSQEAREEFGLLVDTKLDEFQAAREREERQRVEEEQQQMQDLEHDITLAGEQVGELATEIGDLIVRVGKLEVDVVASRKRRQESYEKVLEVERQLQEYVSTRATDVLAIQTFEKALNAYISRPPSPPATPVNTLPPFDYVYQSIEEPMVQALRSHLVPAIEDLRKDVEDMVRTQNAELYSTLWNKITVTLKVLEMIQSKINQGDIEPQSLAGSVVRREV